MSSPVVVQGTPVQPAAKNGGFAGSLSNNNNYANTNAASAAPTASPVSGDRESRKETSCNDPIFALLFYVAVIAIVAVAAVYGPAAFSSDTSNNAEFNYEGYVAIVVIVVFLSFVGAAAGMALLMCIPQFLIKAALIFSVFLSGIMVLLSFATGNMIGGIIGLVFFALTLCYAYMVWKRIPFATANLVTACTAIKANLGVNVYAYMFAFGAGIWSIVWSVAFAGVFDSTYSCDEVTNQCDAPNYFLVFLLFLAFFFVQQVIQNSIHVTVAGVVATWWYAPNECGCCSSAVNHSFIRTMTTSFGSICFGSFLVALLQALKAVIQQARESGDVPFIACIAECIIGCLASILEYFNKWAFVYVGIYGMPYIKAGKSVLELFRSRGWEAIIADDLVGNTLFLISILVGLVMGAVGVLIEVSSDLFADVGGDAKLVAFLLSFLVGLVVTSILMSTIGSGVNTVIVLFAEGPSEFQSNYPELSNKMRAVWSEMYPGSV